MSERALPGSFAARIDSPVAHTAASTPTLLPQESRATRRRPRPCAQVEAMSKRKRDGSAVDPDYDHTTWEEESSEDEEQLADNEKPSVLANMFAGFDEAKLAQIKKAAPPASETPAEAGLSRLERMVEARAEKRAAAAGCESGEGYVPSVSPQELSYALRLHAKQSAPLMSKGPMQAMANGTKGDLKGDFSAKKCGLKTDGQREAMFQAVKSIALAGRLYFRVRVQACLAKTMGNVRNRLSIAILVRCPILLAGVTPASAASRIEGITATHIFFV
jgi:hypothetical protein